VTSPDPGARSGQAAHTMLQCQHAWRAESAMVRRKQVQVQVQVPAAASANGYGYEHNDGAVVLPDLGYAPADLHKLACLSHRT